MSSDRELQNMERELQEELQEDAVFWTKIERCREYQGRMDEALGIEAENFLAGLEADGAGSGSASGFWSVFCELKPGTYGDFRLDRKLGSGSMGVVYKAWQLSAHRWVALKVLSPRLLESPEARRRFQREVVAAARVEHPAICTVYEQGELEGFPYIAMRYIHGPTLEDEFLGRTSCGDSAAGVRGPSLPAADDHDARDTTGESLFQRSSHAGKRQLEELLRTFEVVGRGLHAAHEKGLVHRDIKPGNIMIGTDEDPVIVDFGIARLVEPESEGAMRDLPDESTPLGTPAYMSPEQILAAGVCSAHAHQASGQGDVAVDRRTDVFSLGVTLYECITGSHPFPAKSLKDVFEKILHSDPAPASSRRADVSADLDAVLFKALQKDPRQRYSTALELVEDLRRVRNHEILPWRRTRSLKRARLWVRRNPVGAALILVLGLCLVQTLLFVGFLLDRIHKQYEIREILEAQIGNLLARVEDGAHGDSVLNSWLRARRAGRPLLPMKENPQLRFAIYASDPPEALYAMFDPLLAILEEELQIPIHLHIFPTYQGATDAIVRGKADFARFGPASYVTARSQDGGITLIAREVRNGKAHFQGHIVVNEKSSIQELADLRGRTFCFGAPTSTLGTVLPKKMLLDAGFTPGRIQATYITGHDDVARAILAGRADAGCVKHGTYTDPAFRKGLRSLEVLSNLTKPWLGRNGLDPSIAETIRKTLLSLDDENPAHRKALDAMTEGSDRITGFTIAVPAEFDFIHEALERIQAVWPAPKAAVVPESKERA